MAGQLDFKELEAMIRAGDVDTVLTVIPDVQGRLMGKRVVGHYFLDHVAAEGLRACLYLFTVDIDMEPRGSATGTIQLGSTARGKLQYRNSRILPL